MRPRWPAPLTQLHCNVGFTYCHVLFTVDALVAPLIVAFRPKSSAIRFSGCLASSAARRSRCLRGFVHGLLVPLAIVTAVLPLCSPPASAQERPGTVIGLVYDSTTSVVLAGARVAVVGTTAMGESDEEGQFRLEDVPPGEYEVIFFHPRLGTLGISIPPGQVRVSAGAVSEVYLAVPSRETILTAWCSAEPGTGDTSIGGIVTDALTGVPLPRARVIVVGDRTGVLQRRRVVADVRTEDSGEFRVCKLDSAEELAVAVSFGRDQAPPVDVRGAGPNVLDITITISEPVTITGVVVDHATGGPVPDALVELAGSSFSQLTDSVGAFGFTGVPPGRQIIGTSRLGYAPRVDSLTVFSNEALGLEITLATEAIVLEPIVVTGRRNRPTGLTTPGARFSGLTAAQVDSVAPRIFDFAGLVRAARVPGLSITEKLLADAFGDVQMGVCIEMQRSRAGANPNTCNMVEVRLNDGPVPDPAFFLLNMNHRDIREFQFLTPLEAGLAYGQRGANGVLLIYTR